ncbi:MAG: hypothetical protein OIF34_06175, partial [Porticoccaceae bacterium]|nr:hypothetical protein [Porticoccaceae bacterium]
MLSRMWQSGRQTSYRGVFTYQQGNQLDSFRVVHRVENGKEYESLSRLDGNNQELIRPGNPLHCQRAGEHLLADGESLEDIYQINHHGQERVAGRVADKLFLNPSDFSRNGYRLWLDAATGLLLKAEVLGPANGGNLLERFQFVDLQVGEATQATGDGQTLAVDLLPCAGSEVVASGRWQVNQPPKGFVLS